LITLWHINPWIEETRIFTKVSTMLSIKQLASGHMKSKSPSKLSYCMEKNQVPSGHKKTLYCLILYFWSYMAHQNPITQTDPAPKLENTRQALRHKRTFIALTMHPIYSTDYASIYLSHKCKDTHILGLYSITLGTIYRY
jgi:hypothetical protein